MSKGRYLRDASGRLTFQDVKMESVHFLRACKSISNAFNLIQTTELVEGLEAMFWDYQRGEQIVGLEWDIWNDFIVVAKTPVSEALVREIAEWINSGGLDSLSQT